MVLLGRTTQLSMIAAAIFAAAFVALDPPAADAAPASSSKTLPALVDPASAVDTASGSIVVGRPADDARSIAVYHRSPAGHWSSRVTIPDVSHGTDTLGVQDVQAIAGTEGFFVVTWLYLDDQENGSVWSSTLLPSGRITGPVHLFDTTFSSQLRMAGNVTGGAAVTQVGAAHAARYVRAAGWTQIDTDLGNDPDNATGNRRDVAISVSDAGSVDLTFALRIGDRDHVVQVTSLSGAAASSRKEIYVAPDAVDAHFAIAMGNDGLQTLVTDDSDDAIKVYREDTRRGPFVYRWRKPRGDNDFPSTPRVAAVGHVARVTWRNSIADTYSHTRLYDGTAWRPTQSIDVYSGGNDAVNGGIGIANPLGIGTNGRGVEIGVTERDDGRRALDRSLLELARRGEQTLTNDLAASRPSLDVNPNGVSQTVATQYVTIDGHRVQRTLALVRR